MAIEALAQKVRAGGRLTADEALELYLGAPDASARPAGRRGPPPSPPGPHRHLHHRPQRQLHERLRGAVLVLRVLPAGRRRGRLRPRLRRDLPEDRGDDRTGRRPAAAAGRPQPRPAHRVVRGPLPRGQAALPGLQAARAVVARGAAHLAALAAAGARGHPPPGRRGPRQHSGRRRRDSRRPCAQAAALLQQGHLRRVARRDAPRASRRSAHDGDHDVRVGGDAGGAHRAHAAAARPAGRDRRLHGVHRVELPARAHGAAGRRGDRHRLPADARDGAPGARQLSTTSRRRG